jgi:hypothetical protein
MAGRGRSWAAASQSSTIAQMKASIARAKSSNPFSNTPWFKPPVWVASTLFGTGAVVASTDGAGAWMCVRGGTSAATGGGPVGTPSTANPALWGWIQDGTAYWEHWGQIRGKDTSAALSSRLTYANDSVIRALFSRIKVTIPSPTNLRFSIVGGKFLADPNPPGTIGGPYYWPVIGATQGQLYNSGSAYVEFNTDANLIGFGAQAVAYQWQLRAGVEVNGSLLQDGQVGNLAVCNPGAWALDLSYWNSISGPIKKVRIRLPWNGQAWLLINSIYTESNASIWQEPAPVWSIGHEGDSLSGGGNGAPHYPGSLTPDVYTSLIGCDSYVNNAVGGTGYVNDGGGKSTYLQRINSLVAGKHSAYVVDGNVNDASASSAARLPAVITYLNTLRGLTTPVTPVVVRGNNLLRDANFAQFLAAEQDLKDAVAAINDPYTVFSPNLLASEDATFTGLGGRSTAPTYVGNCDMYFSGALNSGDPGNGLPDQHPLARGYRHMGVRDAKAFEAAINKMA